jgi:hypothetical protein
MTFLNTVWHYPSLGRSTPPPPRSGQYCVVRSSLEPELNILKACSTFECRRAMCSLSFFIYVYIYNFSCYCGKVGRGVQLEKVGRASKYTRWAGSPVKQGEQGLRLDIVAYAR